METIRPTDTSSDGDEEKLIPEWQVAADDQIIWVGVAVFIAMLLLLGWNAWRGNDDEDIAVIAAPIAEGVGIDSIVGDGDDSFLGSTTAAVATPTTVETVTASTAPTTAATVAPSTTEVEPAIGDVQAVIAGLPGAITASLDGSVAVLDGFVANAGEREAAGTAAASLTGIEQVENNLQLLEPEVLEMLGREGVVGPTVSGIGTAVTVSGTLQSEEERAGILAAAAGVDGVTDVIDDLAVSVAADLNELPQVQFTTASADILPASFADLDAAAALIVDTGGVELQIRGYTDITGDAETNLRLSQDRADAVSRYLAAAGVDEAMLSAVGFGETDQFAAGDSDEALAANRVVLFQQTG